MLYEEILKDVDFELVRALKHGEFASAHEGYAVILEEMDELKEHVWMKQPNRDIGKMRKEAVQIAAMAVKFIRMLDMGVRR